MASISLPAHALPLRQVRFVLEYLKDLNGTQAAIRAGYSPRHACVEGSRLLANPRVKEAIERAEEQAQARTQVTIDHILRELARVAFADVTEVAYFENGKLVIRDTAVLERDTRCAIAELSESTGRTHSRKVRMHDKLKALELLGRHLGMFKDKVDVDVQLSIPEILAELKKRREAAMAKPA